MIWLVAADARGWHQLVLSLCYLYHYCEAGSCGRAGAVLLSANTWVAGYLSSALHLHPA